MTTDLELLQLCIEKARDKENGLRLLAIKMLIKVCVKALSDNDYDDINDGCNGGGGDDDIVWWPFFEKVKFSVLQCKKVIAKWNNDIIVRLLWVPTVIWTSMTVQCEGVVEALLTERGLPFLKEIFLVNCLSRKWISLNSKQWLI